MTKKKEDDAKATGRPSGGYKFALLRGTTPDLTQTIELPSVTTILGVLAKPVLPNWAAKATREGIAAVLAQDGLKGATQEDLAAMLKANGTDHNSLSAKGRERGTDTHDYAEKHLRHLKDNGIVLVDEDGSIAAVGAPDTPNKAAFLDWAHTHSIEPILIEQTVVSMQHGFAGTLDLFALVDGTPTLVDFKTSKPGGKVYPETHLQVAAYDAAMRELDLGYPDEYLAVVFMDDGVFLEEWIPNLRFDLFLDALNLYRWMKEMSK